MSETNRVLLINVAALSYELTQDTANTPNLQRLVRDGIHLPMTPSFPAVTSTVQASLTTGERPNRHGIIANGLYDRDYLRVSFWEQSSRLVQARRIWDTARAQDPEFTSAMLFWQNSIGSSNDFIVTPKPIHKHSGGMIQSCYSRPAGLYRNLVERLGRFNLYWYWGPFTSRKGSRWITRCTREILHWYRPNLVLTYLPHLDYIQQRQGPVGEELLDDVRFIDACIGELMDEAAKYDYRVVVVGDYGIEPVEEAIYPNRILADHELLATYEVQGLQYPDYGQSRAFAVVDHQVAHVYCDPRAIDEANRLFRAVPGIENVLTIESYHEWGIDHPRTGDLVLVASPGYWFCYPWWWEDHQRPDFATHVDIHNKPGYDPLELFWEYHPFRVAQNPARIRGSHGRKTFHDFARGGSFMTNWAPEQMPTPLSDTDVADFLLESLGLPIPVPD